MLSGLILGLIDGLSAYFIPEARDMLTTIVVSATAKGLLTGLLVSLVSRRIEGTGANVLTGGAIGALLSLLAAIPTGTYVEIIVPGVIIGVLVGYIVSKWGQ